MIVTKSVDPASVRDARERADLTQVELAVAAGVSPATIHRIEAGRQQPRRRIVIRLARALGVDEDSLLVHAEDSSEPGNGAIFD